MAETIAGTVLLVDDEEQFLDALAARLKHRGLVVETVTAGEEALNKAEGEAFDAVVLDLAMPGLDGIETLRRLKQKHPDLQVIMLTGQASVKNGIDAMQLGAADFLEKPIDLQVLLEKISAARNKRISNVEQGTPDAA